MTLEDMLTAARNVAKKCHEDADGESRKEPVDWSRLNKLRERQRAADLLVQALEAA